ncbi:MAG: aromatic ring-hydroxylating dioxygenase subunit alpha [Pseudomonadota bacterium]
MFKNEQKGLLAKTWQYAAHAAQLPKVGDYITFDIAGESLFCIRGKDLKLRTFYNVCQHRAHQLVQGRGTKSALTCPYHAWTYDLSGGLRAGSNIKRAGIDPKTICLRQVKTEEMHGFIFVNLDPNAKPMDEWFAGVREKLAKYVPDIAKLAPLEWVEIPEQCNWKVSVENYCECYHCALNHPTFTKGVVKADTYNIRPFNQSYVLEHTTDCQFLDDMSYPIDFTRPHAGEYLSLFLWPMFSFQIYPGNVLNTYHWKAGQVDECSVWRGWYSIDGKENEIVRKLCKQDRETTVEEDIHLVESVYRGLKSRGYKPGPLVIDPKGGVKSEHSIKVLQQWFRQSIDFDQDDLH